MRSDGQAMLTPPAVASRLGVSPDKVRYWCASGELPAVDVAQRRGGRPRYRVSLAGPEVFLAGRSAAPVPRTRRRGRRMAGVIQFF
jgi:hypothetical protein